MRGTITEKAATAINELNKSALVLERQMKSGELNKPIADKAVISAQRKVRTWRKDFTAGEIYEIGQYYNELLSKQGNNQYTEQSFVMNHNEAQKPIEVVAKIVNKGTETLSRINQIFESDCVDIKEKVNEGEISRKLNL